MKEQKHLTFLDDLPLTRRAVAFAQTRHGDQRRRGDNAAYLLHLLEVASLLDRSGYPDDVVAAAVLHDVLEDTDAERAELASRFGENVADLVALVSDDPAIAGEEARKDAVRELVREANNEALVVYAADKVSKVRELRLTMATDPTDPEILPRLRRYHRSLEMLEERIPGSRLVELLRFELEAVEQLPPLPAREPSR